MRNLYQSDVEKKMNRENVINLIKPSVRAMEPYKVTELGKDIARMCLNENPYDLPQKIKKEILDYAMERSWSRYPPIVAREL
jgi:histidinol-phosphate/aromatic aminotransferase/cobyric acid decarboxylase-like protein